MAAEPITAGLNLATEILKFFNVPAAEKYIKKNVELKQQLLVEEGKPYDQQDDRLIEEIYAQIQIHLEAVQDIVRTAKKE